MATDTFSLQTIDGDQVVLHGLHASHMHGGLLEISLEKARTSLNEYTRESFDGFLKELARVATVVHSNRWAASPATCFSRRD